MVEWQARGSERGDVYYCMRLARDGEASFQTRMKEALIREMNAIPTVLRRDTVRYGRVGGCGNVPVTGKCKLVRVELKSNLFKCTLSILNISCMFCFPPVFIFILLFINVRMYVVLLEKCTELCNFRFVNCSSILV